MSLLILCLTALLELGLWAVHSTRSPSPPRPTQRRGYLPNDPPHFSTVRPVRLRVAA